MSRSLAGGGGAGLLGKMRLKWFGYICNGTYRWGDCTWMIGWEMILFVKHVIERL